MTLHEPGKYDPACTEARERTRAKACALIIAGGEFGNGFSLQVEEPHEDFLRTLPAVLREVADKIEVRFLHIQGLVE